ncbi:MAG: tetratricopeptide repeat protein [candidate division Zixibacteria bacterium]|nr:tetratricopeptide repeat protein [candidate division Zixibacteria bacterium]
MADIQNSFLERAQRLFDARQFSQLTELYEHRQPAVLRQTSKIEKSRLYFLVACAYALSERFPQAWRLLETLLKEYPNELGVLHLAALVSCRMGEYDRTVIYAGRYFEALDSDGFSQKLGMGERKQAETWHYWGVALKETDRPEEAAVKFRKALEAKGDDLVAYLDLAHLFFQTKKYAEAGSILTEALKKLSETEDLLRLAEVFCAQPEGAAVCLKALSGAGKWVKMLTVLERHPQLRSFDWAKKYKAQALAGLGQWQEARFLYEEYLTAFPEDWEGLNELGNVSFQLGEFERAEECYRLALECNPAWEEGWRNLSVSLSRLGKHQEAKTSLEQYISLVPEDKSVYGFFADLLYRENEFGRAVNFYEDFLRFHPAEKEAWVKLADCYSNLGHSQSALSSYRQAHNLAPDSDEIRAKIDEIRRRLPEI